MGIASLGREGGVKHFWTPPGGQQILTSLLGEGPILSHISLSYLRVTDNYLKEFMCQFGVRVKMFWTPLRG